MIKITDKTRIRVSSKILPEFGLKWFQQHEFICEMNRRYDMSYTSRRGGIMYFKILSKEKFMLFALKYTEHILKK